MDGTAPGLLTPDPIPNDDSLTDFDPYGFAAPSRLKQVWAIGGGKGGVGKSLISSSLAIALARLGHRVTIADMDLGGANLHTLLGVDLPQQTLSDFFASRVDALTSCVVPSGIPHLSLISGARDAVNVANVTVQQKQRLIQQMRELDTDYLLLDLGAGTTFNTIDLFLLSDIPLVALLPEPTSIENAYRFIKSAYYRKLKMSRILAPVHSLIDMAMDPNNPLKIQTPSDLFREVNKQSPECGMRLKEEIERFQPKLIINQARTQTDVDIGFSVKSVCKRYFGLDMDYIGYLDYDSAVWQAVRKKRPPMLEFPNSKLVSSFERIAQYLVKRYGHHRHGS